VDTVVEVGGPVQVADVGVAGALFVQVKQLKKVENNK